MSIKRLIAGRRVVGYAKQHADAGTWLLRAVRDVVLGPRPVWQTLEDPRHGRAIDTINEAGTVDEYDATIRERDHQISSVGSLTALVANAILFAGIETLGCVMVMTNLGYERPENIFFGLAAAAGLFVLVGLSSRPERDPIKYVGIAVLAFVGFTLARQRMVDAVPADGASTGMGLAVTTLLATLGPAFIAEPTLRKLRAIIPDLNHRRHTRRERSVLVKRVDGAHKLRDGVAAAQSAWDDDDRWLTGLYTLTFRARRSEIGATPILEGEEHDEHHRS